MKNSLKSLLLALSAALLALPAVQAEEIPAGGPPDGQRAMNREKMGEKMADELGLSADQKAKMKELNQQQKAELKALHDSAAPAMQEQRAKMEAIRKSYMEKRQAIMTPEQREKATQMRGNMEKRRGEHKPKGERPEKPAEQK
jgi:Spy/CpxP family protein refolding chaperone